MRKISSIDVETGEILNYAIVAVRQKLGNGFCDGWLAMAQNALEMLATSDLQGADLRVLMMLLARLDFENYICISQTELAEALGMKQPNVSRSIKKLLELGILLDGPRFGRVRTYRLNPAYGWRGSAKNHRKALRAAEKAKKAGFTIHDGGKAE